MKIAVPTRDNRVDGHFGHCEYYTVFTISEDNKVVESKFLASPEGCGCKSDIANILQRMGVSLMLAGNMGDGALQKLSMSGIDVVRGCSGEVNDLVLDYLADKIKDSGVSCAQHEKHHGEGHEDDGHSCQH